MKKIVRLFIFALLLSGCYQHIENMGTEKIYTIEDKIQIEIIKQEALDIIYPSNRNHVINQIQSHDEKIYIDLLLKLTNLSQEQYKLEDLFHGRYEIDKTSFDLHKVLETRDYTSLTTTDTIKSGEERYVHFYCEVPENFQNQEITIYLTILGNHQYQYTFTLQEETQINHHKKTIGDILSLKKSQITINQIGQSKTIEPTNKGFIYSYIPTDNVKETFVYLYIDIYNTSNEIIQPQKYIYCEYHLNNHIYQSQIILESDNRKTLEKKGQIDALQTRSLFLTMSIPDEFVNQEGYIELFVEGNTYRIEK